MRVRHIAAGATGWISLNDNLMGVNELGDPSNDANSWSVKFNDKVPNFDEFLFASGDCTKWLVTSTYDAIGQNYAGTGCYT